ncbi:PREDICTED: uncharacterized protein LOC105818632 [Propithecus coquereli]|uniref:uncharacterized protein LOC105818632 n=1 Tax=Propithecus coquereli TaxID=379532 RepID=UPI00063F1A77|nr:PREDICTED: uncharacterized protein LOC105818632 [Propithecus coquereli]
MAPILQIRRPRERQCPVQSHTASCENLGLQTPFCPLLDTACACHLLPALVVGASGQVVLSFSCWRGTRMGRGARGWHSRVVPSGLQLLPGAAVAEAGCGPGLHGRACEAGRGHSRLDRVEGGGVVTGVEVGSSAEEQVRTPVPGRPLRSPGPQPPAPRDGMTASASKGCGRGQRRAARGTRRLRLALGCLAGQEEQGTRLVTGVPRTRHIGGAQSLRDTRQRRNEPPGDSPSSSVRRMLSVYVDTDPLGHPQDEDTEAQRAGVTCPRPPAKEGQGQLPLNRRAAAISRATPSTARVMPRAAVLTRG